MGHAIEVETYEEDVSKEWVQGYWNSIATKYSDWHTGLSDDIEWRDEIMPSYNAARDWVEENDHSYYQVAIRYRTNNVLKHSVAYKKTKEKLETLLKRQEQEEKKIHYKNVKAALVTCRHCESKISRKYLRSNNCPVCGSDMRPEAIQAKAAKLSKEIQQTRIKLGQLLQKDLQKDEKTSGIRWYVKVEYHE